MLKLIALAAILLLSKLLIAQCNCNNTTEVDNQDRTEAKHVSSFSHFVKKTDTVNAAYIIKLEKKFKSVTSMITKSAHGSNSSRQPGTPEDTLYILKGFMWYVGVEENDCDFHIEIGPSKKGNNRVVVEVAKENETLQKKIKDHLDANSKKIFNCTIQNKKKAHFVHPLPVVVVGLGFYDASHKPNTNHGDKHTKKVSWELHPVKDIIFL